MVIEDQNGDAGREKAAEAAQKAAQEAKAGAGQVHEKSPLMGSAKPTVLTPENIGEFTPNDAGHVTFSASRESYALMMASVATKVSQVAGGKGFNAFQIDLALNEAMKNAAQYGCNYDPKEKVELSWVVRDSEAAFVVVNNGSRLFYPPRYLGREAEDVADQLTADEFESNLHVGTQLALSYSGKMEYEWDLPGGEKVQGVLTKKPGSTDENLLWDFKAHRIRDGKKESIDLKTAEDSEKPELSDRMSVKMTFTK